MAATIGPLFASEVTAPREWNENVVQGGDGQRFLKTAQGLGLEVLVYSRELMRSLDSGGTAWAFFAQVLREDGETVYAFASPLERQLFCEIKDIDGIGAKYAATALLELGPAGVKRLLDNPSAAPAKLPGLGPKTIEKIKNGVRAKKENFAVLLRATGQSVAAAASASALSHGGAAPLLIVQALSQVGLRVDETERLYHDVIGEEPEAEKLGTGELIKLILKRRAQYKNAKPAAAEVSS